MNKITALLKEAELIKLDNSIPLSEKKELIETILNEVEQLNEGFFGFGKKKEVSAEPMTPAPIKEVTPFAMAMDGDITAFKKYLDDGGDINIKSYRGETVIVYAIEHGNNDFVNFLLDNGVSINSKTSNGTPIILYAWYSRAWDIVKNLIDRGVDINSQGTDGTTLLMLALSRGDAELAAMLIKKGADIFARHNSGNDMIDFAVRGSIDKKYPKLFTYIQNKLNDALEIGEEKDKKGNIIFTCSSCGSHEYNTINGKKQCKYCEAMLEQKQLNEGFFGKLFGQQEGVIKFEVETIDGEVYGGRVKIKSWNNDNAYIEKRIKEKMEFELEKPIKQVKITGFLEEQKQLNVRK